MDRHFSRGNLRIFSKLQSKILWLYIQAAMQRLYFSLVHHFHARLLPMAIHGNSAM